MTATLGLQNFQGTYDASTSQPMVTLDSTNGAFSIRNDAAQLPAVELQSPGGTAKLEINPGPTGGRGGIRHLPTNYTNTVLPTVTYALQWDSVVTSNIPGGAPFGNDTAPAMVGAIGECIFADQGGLFSSSLLFNQGTTITCQANVGPVYTMVNQPLIRADGGSFSCSQHNALRIQPSWGPNLSGGSITQTSAVYILNTATVDATVGSSSVTTLTYWQALSPTLTSGGTVGTFTAIDIANVTGPTTIRGINSAMSSGTFIRHTGTAPSDFSAANLRFTASNIGVELGSSQNVLLNWNGTGFEWDPVTGDDLRIAFASGSHTVTSSSASVLRQIRFGMPKAAFGQTSAIGNQKFVFAANAETWTGGGTSIDQVLLTQAGNDTVTTTNVTRFSGWAINAPNITIDAVNRVTTITGVTIAGSMSVSGSTVTNKAALYITSNPSGGTGENAAFWITAGRAIFDGVLRVQVTNDAGRGAAGEAGRVIFNTDDGNLNIDDGTNWILPDGSTT